MEVEIFELIYIYIENSCNEPFIQQQNCSVLSLSLVTRPRIPQFPRLDR